MAKVATEFVVLAVVWAILAPILVLVIPVVVMAKGPGSTTIWNMLGNAPVGLALLGVVAILGLLLRWRKPFGGGNSAATVGMFMGAIVAVVLEGLGVSGGEAVGLTLVAAVLALPGAIGANLALVSWGRGLAKQQGLEPKNLSRS